MIIDYSNDFTEKAKIVFPKWKQLHEAISYNESDSVRIALGSIKTLISPNEVVTAFDTGQISKLYHRARQLKEVVELENMWYEEFDRSEEEITQKNQLSILEKELFST